MSRPLFQRPQIPHAALHRARWLGGTADLRATIRNTAISLSGGVVTNVTGLLALVWHGVPSDMNAVPAEVVTGVEIDGAGLYEFEIDASSLQLGDPVTYVLVEQGQPPTTTRHAIRTEVPHYSS